MHAGPAKAALQPADEHEAVIGCGRYGLGNRRDGVNGPGKLEERDGVKGTNTKRVDQGRGGKSLPCASVLDPGAKGKKREGNTTAWAVEDTGACVVWQEHR